MEVLYYNNTVYKYLFCKDGSMKLIFSGDISSDVRTDRQSQTLGLP